MEHDDAVFPHTHIHRASLILYGVWLWIAGWLGKECYSKIYKIIYVHQQDARNTYFDNRLQKEKVHTVGSSITTMQLKNLQTHTDMIIK